MKTVQKLHLSVAYWGSNLFPPPLNTSAMIKSAFENRLKAGLV